MAQPRMVYNDTTGEMEPMTRRTANGGIETMMSDGSWQVTSAAPGPTTWNADNFSQFWNNPDQGGRFDPRAGDIFPITTPEDLVKWGFGNQSPDMTKGLTEYIPGGSLADFQAQTQSLPFQFTDAGAVYDPAARVNPMNYEGTPDWREMAWPAAFAALAGAGLGGMLPGTENVFAGLGAPGAAEGSFSMNIPTGGPVTSALSVPAAGTFNPATATLSEMTGAIAGGATPAVSGGGLGSLALTDAALGLAPGGLAAVLGGTGSTIPGVLGNIALDAAGNQVSTGVNLANSAQAAAPGLGSSVAGTASSGNALADLLGVSPGTLDLIGKGLGAGIGLLGSNAQTNALQDLQSQMTAQRAPFLNKATGYLNNPESFYTSPEATGAANATLRALSTQYGNPGVSPTAQALTTGALYDRYTNTVNSLGSLGLSGQGIQANLGSQIASTAGQPYAIGGNLIGGLTAPNMGIDKLLQQQLQKMFGGSGVTPP